MTSTTETETPTVRRLRKKQIEVDVLLWDGTNVSALAQFTNGQFAPVDPEDRGEDPDITGQVYDVLHSTWVGVKTGQSVVRGVKGEFYPIDAEVLDETYEDEVPVRTWRVEYNATADGSFSESFVQADERDRIVLDGRSWTVFRRNDLIVTEIPDRVISLIEEMQPLTLSEREELEALRETVEIMSDPDTMAGLAEADDEAEQTDWSAYRPCGTCLQETGEPCRFVRFEGGVGEARINPHLNRERIPAATA